MDSASTEKEVLDYWQPGEGYREIRRHRRRSPKWLMSICVLAGIGLIAVGSPIETPANNAYILAEPRYIDRADRAEERLPRIPYIFIEPAKPVTQPVVPPKPPAPRPPSWAQPVTKYRVSSCYTYRWGRMHNGIDMAARTGTPIRSVGVGRVVQAGWRFSGYGYSVMVDHGQGWLSFYGHASKVLVRAGQRVTAGQRIALVGSTGFSTGPHLHFGITRYKFGNWVSPKPWLAARGVRINGC